MGTRDDERDGKCPQNFDIRSLDASRSDGTSGNGNDGLDERVAVAAEYVLLIHRQIGANNLALQS